MKVQKILLPIIIIIAALAFFSIFVVKEVNQAIVLQFGDPKKIILKPGLKLGDIGYEIQSLLKKKVFLL